MEFIFEIILELLFEGGQEICSNRRITKWIRYPIAFILILITVIVIFGIMFLGMYLLKENTLMGLFFIIVSIILLIGAIIKFKNVYIAREKE